MKELSAGERIKRRKQVESEWLCRWKGRLNSPEAKLDLWRWYLRRGVCTLDDFRRVKESIGVD